MKHKSILGAALILAMSAPIVFAADWLIEKNPPPAIGPEVMHGRTSDPGSPWTATEEGLLQEVYWNVDPRCNEEGVVAVIERSDGSVEKYTVPSATSCQDPKGDWYVSRVFDMQENDTAHVKFGTDSTRYWFYFATSTPTPTETSTPVHTMTPTATDTALPPETVTSTPTATETPENTVTATPTATATETATATPTDEIGLPPTISRCVKIWTEPPLPKALPVEGMVVTIYVQAENPQGYTLFDGKGYQFFENQPLVGITILPNHTYRVTAGSSDIGCALGRLPTGLERGEQPPMQRLLFVPFVRQE